MKNIIILLAIVLITGCNRRYAPIPKKVDTLTSLDGYKMADSIHLGDSYYDASWGKIMIVDSEIIGWYKWKKFVTEYPDDIIVAHPDGEYDTAQWGINRGDSLNYIYSKDHMLSYSGCSDSVLKAYNKKHPATPIWHSFDINPAHFGSIKDTGIILND